MSTLTLNPAGSTSVSRQAFTNLRAYSQLLKRIAAGFQSEWSLTSKHGARLIYLIDFEVLFSLMAPYIDMQRTEDDYIHHLSAADFFSSTSSQVALPPGTLAELGRFLQRQMKQIRDLGAVQEATSLENAVSSFRNYLESSLHKEKEFDLDQYGEGNRLMALQLQAIDLLARHQRAIGVLEKFFQKITLFDLYELVSTHPVAIPKYRDFFTVIQRARSDRESRHNDMADALNMSFTYSINVQMERRFLDKKIPLRHVFRLVTNTRTLHRIANGRTKGVQILQDLTYIGPEEERLPLVTGTDEAIGTEQLHVRFQAPTDQGYRDFRRTINDSDLAILELEAAASSRGVTPSDILTKLLDPVAPEDRELFLQCKNAVDVLHSLIRLGSDSAPGFVERNLRRYVFSPNNDSPAMLLGSNAAYDLSALENLIDSICQVLDRVDTLGYHLTPFQAGDFSLPSAIANPVASLRNLGVELVSHEEGAMRQWGFRKSNAKRNLLSIERSNGHWSCYWQTAVPAGEAVAQFAKYYSGLPGSMDNAPSKLRLIIIHPDGREETLRVAPSVVGEVLGSLPAISFFRLEAPGQTFTSEIYAPIAPYRLNTGFITDDFNFHFVEKLFIPTSKYRGDVLLCRLIRNRLTEIFSEGN